MDGMTPINARQSYPMFDDYSVLQLGGRAMPTTRKAATEFEALFVQQLIQTMRETVRSINPDPLFGGGQDAQIFMSMFDQELAKGIAAEGGLGLADALVRQLDGHSLSSASYRPISDAESFNNLNVRG
jgi:flagellar protein FlgJ